MLEDFFATLENFKTYKLRTALSLLGIIIGIMAVIIITTLGSSMYNCLVQILKKEVSLPYNALNIYTEWNPKTGKNAFEQNEKYRKLLFSSTNKIKNIFYNNSIPVNVLKGSTNAGEMFQNQSLSGVEYDFLENMGTKLDTGEFFVLSDFAERREKTIISYDLATHLFPEGNAVGKKISVTIPSMAKNKNPIIFYLEVIGVTQKSKSSRDPETKIFVPRSFVLSLTNMKTAHLVTVFLKDEKDYDEAKRIITSYSDKFANFENSVYIFSPKEIKADIDKFLTIVQLILSAIAFISLFVGGVNIMNIMIATVTERHKEIGIRKALGATKSAITLQFLVESITLTLMGGGLGVIFGLGLSYLVIGLIPITEILNMPDAKMPFVTNPKGTIIAFTVSVCVGIFFGLRPARKAAALNPIEILS